MNIAVLADVHGRILLAFKIIERYQRETGEQIDLILQCGDVGIFPDITRLDKATERIAQLDETELGFAEYFADRNPEARAVLDKLSCDMICVRGNHEDHSFLDELETQHEGAIFPVDCYQRVWCMKTGVVHSVKLNGDTLDVLGIGRVGAPDGEADPTRDKYIQQREQDQLKQAAGEPIDILLTHDARRDFIRPGIGMQEISDILDRQTPAYHFFGHTGRPFERKLDGNGTTLCSKLSDFEWEETDRGKRMKDGCLGVLRWNGPTDHSFRVVEDSCIKEYTPFTWKHL